MYQLSVHREFCAAHAIAIHGRLEPVHGHNWRVEAVVRGEQLDDDGLLCDFHRLEAILDRIIGPLHNRHLNDVPPFNKLNPTAEHVAKHIGERVVSALPQGVRLHRVSLSEAPGCVASWFP